MSTDIPPVPAVGSSNHSSQSGDSLGKVPLHPNKGSVCRELLKELISMTYLDIENVDAFSKLEDALRKAKREFAPCITSDACLHLEVRRIQVKKVNIFMPNCL